jgi:hypothetical protein
LARDLGGLVQQFRGQIGCDPLDHILMLSLIHTSVNTNVLLASLFNRP